MEGEIRKVYLRQDEDERKQKQLENQERPTPPLHGIPSP
jgi:hypothetical protein